MSAADVPEWMYPPEGRDWTVDDLPERVPMGAPRRVEVIDGGLVVMSPQTAFHMLVLRALEQGLLGQVPEGLAVAREWTVALPNGDGPEPDIIVIGDAGLRDLNQTRVEAKHVRMAVEVVSPDSRKRDLFRKPELYADAGIEHYWIVDHDGSATIVRTYHRDPAGGYQPTGEHRDHIVTASPFSIDLDLSSAALGFG